MALGEGNAVLVLEPAGQVRGRLVLPEDADARWFRVGLEREGSNLQLELRVSDQGDFGAASLDPGSYRLTVLRDGVDKPLAERTGLQVVPVRHAERRSLDPIDLREHPQASAPLPAARD